MTHRIHGGMALFKPRVPDVNKKRTSYAPGSNLFIYLFQACRNGLVQHLDHLLFYGADMNGRNASGNTPLHVCAVNAQDSCARQLLFRGCDKEALNFANQTPYQVTPAVLMLSQIMPHIYAIYWVLQNLE